MRILLFCLCSVLTLSAAPHVGRLFIAPVYLDPCSAILENQPVDSVERAERLIREGKLGGVLFKHLWEFEALQKVAKRLQEAADYPLILCIDCESGLAQRVLEYAPLPKPNDTEEAFTLGEQIAREVKSAGLNMALAPVLDVQTNHLSPIGKRALASDPRKAAALGAALIRGIQGEGILACGKHFPGHGDTTLDSHFELPILSHSPDRLQQVELLPFEMAIEEGVASIMTGHLVVSVYDTLPASLSHVITTDLLQKNLGFEGIIITDDLLMKAVPQRGAATKAFIAGADLILVPPHLEEEIAALERIAPKEEVARRAAKIEQIFRSVVSSVEKNSE